MHGADLRVISEPSNEGAAERTAEQMREVEAAGRGTLAQATFLVEPGLIARADILEYDGEGGWHITEVKSCTSEAFKEYLPDIAFTTLVAMRSGLQVSRAFLVVASPRFRLGDREERRYERIDCTELLLGEEGLVRQLESGGSKKAKHAADRVAAATGKGQPAPAPAAVPACKGCSLQAACFGPGLRHPVWELPRLVGKRFSEVASKTLELDELTAVGNKTLTDAQRKHWLCVRRGQRMVDRDRLREELGRVCWPVYYLDFEAMATLSPLYPGVAPYQQILTQYSLHRAEALDHPLTHAEYIADPSRDCREELAERMLEDLGDEGSIMVYSSYEMTQMEGLMRLMPWLTDRLLAVISRLVDLEKVVRGCVADPEFRGRTSIKVVLPALVPAYEGRYKRMAVSDGGQASLAFFRMAVGLLPGRGGPLNQLPAAPPALEEERQTLREDLLRYCELDTLAMVELHRALHGLSLDSAASMPPAA